jgi:hypothetical protein
MSDVQSKIRKTSMLSQINFQIHETASILHFRTSTHLACRLRVYTRRALRPYRSGAHGNRDGIERHLNRHHGGPDRPPPDLPAGAGAPPDKRDTPAPCMEPSGFGLSPQSSRAGGCEICSPVAVHFPCSRARDAPIGQSSPCSPGTAPHGIVVVPSAPDGPRGSYAYARLPLQASGRAWLCEGCGGKPWAGCPDKAMAGLQVLPLFTRTRQKSRSRFR